VHGTFDVVEIMGDGRGADEIIDRGQGARPFMAGEMVGQRRQLGDPRL